MSKHDRKRGETFVTPIGRVCYPHVFKPRSVNGAEPKYSLILVFTGPDAEEAVKVFRRFEKEVSRAAWKTKPPAYRSPIRPNSDMVDVETGERKRGFEEEGYFVRFSSSRPPEVIGPRKETITEDTPNGFYPGCYARVACNAYSYDQTGSRGVSFGLQNVQKTKDGEPIAGWVAAARQFDEVEVDDEGWDDKAEEAEENEDGEDW